MILKFREDTEQHQDFDWWVYDGVDRVHYSESLKFQTTQDLHSWLQNIDTDLILVPSAGDESYKGPYWINLIHFRQNGELRLAVTEDIVFVCNDEGKTIDRIPVAAAHF